MSITCNLSLNWEVVRWWYGYVLGDGAQHRGKVGVACSPPLVVINSPRQILINCIQSGKGSRRTTSVSNTRKEWNFLNSGDFLSTFLGTLNCQASPSGYLQNISAWMTSYGEEPRHLPWYLYRRRYQLILEDSITQSRNVDVFYGCVQEVGCSNPSQL